MTAVDLVVIGDANPDVIVTGAPERIRYGQRERLLSDGRVVLGGSAAITACGAARLGLRTALVAVVGDDAAGALTLDRLRAAGVDVSAVRVAAGATPLSVILRNGADRAILTYRGVLDELSAADVPGEVLRGCRAVHAASYFLQPRLATGLPGLFADARAAGAMTSLDTNDDPDDRWAGLAGVLAHTDVVLPNERELLHLAGTWASPRRTPPDGAPAPAGAGRERAVGVDAGPDPSGVADAVPPPRVPAGGAAPRAGSGAGPSMSTVEHAALVLADHGVLPVVALGAAGALSVSDGAIVRAGAPVVRVVDSIGAGDNLTAGFLAGRLAGRPVPESLRLAVACGSLSTRGAGGTATQPTRAEADACRPGAPPTTATGPRG